MKRRTGITLLIMSALLLQLPAADLTLGVKSGYAIRNTKTSTTEGNTTTIERLDSRYVPVILDGRILFPISDTGLSLGISYGLDMLQIPASDTVSAYGTRIQFDPYAGIAVRYMIGRFFAIDGALTAGYEAARPVGSGGIYYNGAVMLAADIALSFEVSHIGLSSGLNTRFPVYTLSGSEGKRLSGYILLPYASLYYRF